MKLITNDQEANLNFLKEKKYSYLDTDMGKLYSIESFTENENDGLDFILVDKNGKKKNKFMFLGDIEVFMGEFKPAVIESEPKVSSKPEVPIEEKREEPKKYNSGTITGESKVILEEKAVVQNTEPENTPIPEVKPTPEKISINKKQTKIIRDEVFKYIHLYMGCEFVYISPQEKLRGKITNVQENGGFFGQGKKNLNYESSEDYMELWWWEEWPEADYVQLILLDTGDLSAEQLDKYYSLCLKRKIPQETLKVDTPESLRYLLSIGVDCFDLIKRGLAIRKQDADKIKFDNE